MPTDTGAAVAPQDAAALVQRLGLAEQALGFGVWDLDPTAERVAYSPAFRQLAGVPHTGSHDRTSVWRSRVHPDDLGPMLDALLAHLRGQAADYTTRFRLRMACGGYRWMLSRGRVVERDRDGRALRMVGTLTDMDAMRDTLLLEARREVLTRLSHELRTPLNAVLGFAQLLEAGVGRHDEATQRHHLDQIQRAGWTMLRQVEALLQQLPGGGGDAQPPAQPPALPPRR